MPRTRRDGRKGVPVIRHLIGERRSGVVPFPVFRDSAQGLSGRIVVGTRRMDEACPAFPFRPQA